MKRKHINSLILSILLYLFIVIVFTSCRHADVISGTDIRTVYFDKEILPIFVNQCGKSGCHGGDGERRNYITYDGILKGVTPGQPYNSKIYSAIISVYSNTMPPGKPISENQRTLIKVWIEQGAKNNVEPDTTKKVAIDTTKLADTTAVVSFNKQILPIFKASCAVSGCHNAAPPISSFTSYELIMKDVLPGNPSLSKIYQRITGSTNGNKMPMGSTLTPNQTTLIRLWISQGAKKDSGSVVIIPPPIKPDTQKVDLGYACFSRDILPIVQSNCAKCHTFLTNYTQIMQWVEEPGNPFNTTLYSSITASGEDAMPRGYRLPQSNIDTIYSWIKHGATNGTCVLSCDTIHYNFNAQVMPIINSNCIGCHSGSTPQGNIVLSDYTSMLAAVNNGKLQKILNNKTMPPINSLSDCKATVIKKWINDGAKNN
jgi:uncharacterized membrane protein